MKTKEKLQNLREYTDAPLYKIDPIDAPGLSASPIKEFQPLPELLTSTFLNMSEEEYYQYRIYLNNYQKSLREYIDRIPDEMKTKKEKKEAEQQIRELYKSLIIADCRVFNQYSKHTLEQTREALKLDKGRFNTIYQEIRRDIDRAREMMKAQVTRE